MFSIVLKKVKMTSYFTIDINSLWEIKKHSGRCPYSYIELTLFSKTGSTPFTQVNVDNRRNLCLKNSVRV